MVGHKLDGSCCFGSASSAGCSKQGFRTPETLLPVGIVGNEQTRSRPELKRMARIIIARISLRLGPSATIGTSDSLLGIALLRIQRSSSI